MDRADRETDTDHRSIGLPAGPSDEALQRAIGPVGATCVVVGAIIGVGIFITPRSVAALAGGPELTLLAWSLGGAIALMGALTFAGLGRLYPRTAGQYEILRDAYGPMPAFVYVFCNATAVQAGAVAIIAVVCAKNFLLAFGQPAPDPRALPAMAAFLIVALMAANGLGVKWGSTIQNVTVYAKVMTLIAVTVVAAVVATNAPPPAPVDPPPPGTTGFGVVAVLFAAMVPAFFAYGGWQHALWIAGEVRHPERNVPRAIIVGVVIVVVVYLLVNWAYLRLLGYDHLVGSDTPAADALATVWPRAGRRAMGLAVAVSAFGVLNAQLLSGPRLIYGMAADGRFFKPFARVSRRFQTPVPAILMLGGAALLLLFVAGPGRLDKLITGVVFIDGVFFVLTGFAPFLLMRRRDVAFRSGATGSVFGFGYPVVPALFVLGEVGIVIGAYCDASVRQAAYIGTIWIAGAIAVYLVFFARRAKQP